jgi:AGZA family xanthine/uracil permease-like MFS transporter
MLSVDQGFLFTAMIFASIAVFMIERNFRKASLWSMIAALFSFFGLIHGYTITEAGVIPHIGWGAAKAYALNYFCFSVLFLGIHYWSRSQSVEAN